jgi:excisionase family DNA binding protein
LEHTLTRYLDACTPEAPAPDQEWLSLREAAEMTGYSATYLSQLARSGRIEAIKRGRLWYTTLQAVKAYAAEQGFTGS